VRHYNHWLSWLPQSVVRLLDPAGFYMSKQNMKRGPLGSAIAPVKRAESPGFVHWSYAQESSALNQAQGSLRARIQRSERYKIVYETPLKAVALNAIKKGVCSIETNQGEFRVRVHKFRFSAAAVLGIEFLEENCTAIPRSVAKDRDQFVSIVVEALAWEFSDVRDPTGELVDVELTV